LDPASNPTLSYTVVFSESINPTTFTSADVLLGGTGTGTVGTPATTDDNITWTVHITTTTSGTIIATVPAGGISDLAGNTNNASTSTDANITYDGTAPSVTSLTPTDGAAISDETANLVITFDEPVDVQTGNIEIYDGLSPSTPIQTVDVTS